MADLVTSRVFVDGERGITAAKLNDIIGSSVIQPAFYTAKPTASSLAPTDIMLAVKAGAYVQAPFQTVIDSVSAGLSSDAEIWAVRQRSFNAIGNANFSVRQKNVGASISFANGVAFEDRWALTNNLATGRLNAQAINGYVGVPSGFTTNDAYATFTLTTAQASLAAGEVLYLAQIIEGANYREMVGSVGHSLQVYVRSSVANLKFSCVLKDPGPGPSTKSLVKLCTLGAANTWTLITMPNLPTFPAGNFGFYPGTAGYQFSICLGSGATFTAPAADTWQNGNFVAAPGADNFASKPVNSTFDVAFVQHEPGQQCSSLIDKSFSQNLDECQRYFQKTSSYGSAVGTGVGAPTIYTMAAQAPFGNFQFKRTMAKFPTITGYSSTSAAINTVRDLIASVDRTITGVNSVGDNGFNGFNIGSSNASVTLYGFHYTADTGW